MAELKDGCVKPARGPIAAPGAPGEAQSDSQSAPGFRVEEQRMQARVGREAPDFEATAFVAGKGFEQVQLSDYKGKWIVLCFYPGDFTFV